MIENGKEIKNDEQLILTQNTQNINANNKLINDYAKLTLLPRTTIN